MLQSLALLYAQHTLARKIKYDKNSAILQTIVPSITDYNRLLDVVRSIGALFRASSWHLQTVQLRRELSKYVMGVLSA